MISPDLIESARRVALGMSDDELIALGHKLVAIGASPRSEAARLLTIECIRRGIIRPVKVAVANYQDDDWTTWPAAQRR